MPCEASVRAAMIPATPPPSISTCVSGACRAKGVPEAGVSVKLRAAGTGIGRGSADTVYMSRHSATAWSDKENIASLPEAAL